LLRSRPSQTITRRRGTDIKIGVDFDNTIVCYDQAFEQVGREVALLPAHFRGGREAAKAWLLERRPDGYLWEKLQGLVYGRCIGQAKMFDGVAEFFRTCRKSPEVIVKIVSHKTVRAHHDPTDTDLRKCAMDWMAEQGFFESSTFGLGTDDVYFESTREDKVRRIAELGCNVFVDDHPEVLSHAGMPEHCRKILFRSQAEGAFERAANWQDVRHAIFGWR
jgi:hypothetical protein